MHSNLHFAHNGKNKTRKQNPYNLKFILLNEVWKLLNLKKYLLYCFRVIIWISDHSNKSYTLYQDNFFPFLRGVLSCPIKRIWVEGNVYRPSCMETKAPVSSFPRAIASSVAWPSSSYPGHWCWPGYC